MLCNPASAYPDKIDEMTFFQDNSLEKLDIMRHYDSLVTQGKYSDANAYISQQEGIYGFFAEFFNLIENRIYSLQEHLLQKPPKKQPFLFYDEEFSYPFGENKIYSNTEEAENMERISLFSAQDQQESTDRIETFTGEEKEPPHATLDTIWI